MSTRKPKEEPKVKYNTAVVLTDKGNEVRRYSEELHGENYVELAHSIADKNGYIVKLVEVKEVRVCPHCGGKIYN